MPKQQIIKPTTMRIPPPLLARVDKAAAKEERSRSFMINQWIEEGLRRVEKQRPAGALD